MSNILLVLHLKKKWYSDAKIEIESNICTRSEIATLPGSKVQGDCTAHKTDIPRYFNQEASQGLSFSKRRASNLCFPSLIRLCFGPTVVRKPE